MAYILKDKINKIGNEMEIWQEETSGTLQVVVARSGAVRYTILV